LNGFLAPETVDKIATKCKLAVRLTHLPTVIVQTAQTRSREGSYKQAHAAILQLLAARKTQTHHQQIDQQQSQIIGNGCRGVKILTLQFQNDQVTHHLTGKRITASKYCM
jgi:protein subunit release factor A